MYVRKNDLTFIVNDNQSYIGESGIKYPWNYPKDTIQELTKVIETEEPTKCVILGYHIDSTYTQVWDYREYNESEIYEQEKQSWEQEFYSLDKDFPRYIEDIINVIGESNLPEIQKERNKRKKELRQLGKEKGYI